MFKSLRSVVLGVVVAFSVTPAQAAPLLTALKAFADNGDNGIVTAIARSGIDAAGSQQIVDSLIHGLKAHTGKDLPNASDLKRIFGEDIAKKFAKDTDDLGTNELKELLLINTRISKSARGKKLNGVMTNCSNCLDASVRRFATSNGLKASDIYISLPATKTMEGIMEAAAKDPIGMKTRLAHWGRQNRINGFGGQGTLAQQIDGLPPELMTDIYGFLEICNGKASSRRDACMQLMAIMKDTKGNIDFAANPLFRLAFEDLSSEPNGELVSLAQSLRHEVLKGGEADDVAAKTARLDQWVETRFKKQGMSDDEIRAYRGKLCQCYKISCPIGAR